MNILKKPSIYVFVSPDINKQLLCDFHEHSEVLRLLTKF